MTNNNITEEMIEAGLRADRDFADSTEHRVVISEIYTAMQAASQPPVTMDGLVERVAGEIERYGEGLVPELRIVCVWLAAHFRDNEDARKALESQP